MVQLMQQFEHMSVVKKDEALKPADDLRSLALGAWVTDATGFACVRPRAQSDLQNAVDTDDQADDDKECGTTLSADEVQPRIERYRER